MEENNFIHIDPTTLRDEFAYHKMTTTGDEVSKNIRLFASVLLNAMDNLEPSRETSLAKTKLEESVMWANKSLALHGTRILELE